MAQTPEHAARVLGLIGEISLDAVKQARRDMALQYHPDRCGNSARASRRMARVNAAADTLIAALENQQKVSAPETEAPSTADTADRAAAKSRTASAKKRRSMGSRQRGQAARAKTAADAARGAWTAERALAKRAKASYRKALGGIGKTGATGRVDMQILRFDSTDP